MYMTSPMNRSHHSCDTLNTSSSDAIRSGQFMVSNLDDFSSDEDPCLEYASLKSLDSPVSGAPKERVTFKLFLDKEESYIALNQSTAASLSGDFSEESSSVEAQKLIKNDSGNSFMMEESTTSTSISCCSSSTSPLTTCDSIGKIAIQQHHPSQILQTARASGTTTSQPSLPTTTVSSSSAAIDDSLAKLFQCLTVAYRGKVASPKWNFFRGMKVSLKEKIRLNNIIWREYHMQFVMHKNPVVVQFASTLLPERHANPEAMVLEGLYWKRKLELVREAYQHRPGNDNHTSGRSVEERLLSHHHHYHHHQTRRLRLRSLSEVESGRVPVSSSISTLLAPSPVPLQTSNVNLRLVEKMDLTQGSISLLPGFASPLVQIEPVATAQLDVAEDLYPPPVNTTVENVQAPLLSSMECSEDYNLDLEGLDFDFDSPLNADVIQPVLMQLQPTVEDIHCLFDDFFQPPAMSNCNATVQLQVPPTFTAPCPVSRQNEAMEIVPPSNYFSGPPRTVVPSSSSSSSTRHFLTVLPTVAESSSSGSVSPALNKLSPQPHSTVLPRTQHAVMANVGQGRTKEPFKNPQIMFRPTSFPTNPGTAPGRTFTQLQTMSYGGNTLEKSSVLPKAPHLLQIAPKNMGHPPPSSSQQQAQNLLRSQSLISPSVSPRERLLDISVIQRRHATMPLLRNVPPHSTFTDPDSNLMTTTFSSTISSTNNSLGTSSGCPIYESTVVGHPDVDKSYLSSSGVQHHHHQGSSDVSESLHEMRMMLAQRQPSSITLAHGFVLLQNLLSQLYGTNNSRSQQQQLSSTLSTSSVGTNVVVPMTGKVSKSTLLHQAVDAIRRSKERDRLLEEEVVRLQAEADALQDNIDRHCAQLPATGVSVKNNKGCSPQLQEWFLSYIEHRCEHQWKFYPFSLVLQQMFATYTASMTNASNASSFPESVANWVEQYCSLPSLRQVVTESLRELSRETSILVDPCMVPQQVHQLVAKWKKPRLEFQSQQPPIPHQPLQIENVRKVIHSPTGSSATSSCSSVNLTPILRTPQSLVASSSSGFYSLPQSHQQQPTLISFSSDPSACQATFLSLPPSASSSSVESPARQSCIHQPTHSLVGNRFSAVPRVQLTVNQPQLTSLIPASNVSATHYHYNIKGGNNPRLGSVTSGLRQIHPSRR